MIKLTPKFVKIFKTCNLYLCFFTLGLCIAVPGPCLLDLRQLVNTDTQHIAFIYTARSIGYLVGSVLGGIILDMVKHKQAILMIGNLVTAASMFAVPWSTNLGSLTAYMVVNGLALGCVDIGGNVICLTIWGSDSGPFYQALHFTFGLGGLVAPLVAAPFLGDYAADAMNSDNATLFRNNSNFTTDLLYNNSGSTIEGLPQIFYPFTIIGACGIFVTVLFLIACIVAPTEEPRAKENSDQDQKRALGLIFTLVFLNFLLLLVETGTEIGYAQMLTTYAVKGPLQLSSSTGSYMTSTFWAAFTLSRLASIFLAIKVSNFTLIVADLIISSAGAAVLLFLKSYEWSLWVSSVLLGAGIASFFPAAIGWLDTYITVTNKIASIFTVGASFGEMAIPLTISSYIDTVPEVLLYVVPASSILSTIIVIILYLILRKEKTKCIDQKSPCPADQNSSVNA